MKHFLPDCGTMPAEMDKLPSTTLRPVRASAIKFTNLNEKTMAAINTTHLSSVMDTEIVSEVAEVVENNEGTDHSTSSIDDVIVPNDEIRDGGCD